MTFDFLWVERNHRLMCLCLTRESEHVTIKEAINYCTCDTVDGFMDNILHQLGWLNIATDWISPTGAWHCPSTLCVYMYMSPIFPNIQGTTPCKCVLNTNCLTTYHRDAIEMLGMYHYTNVPLRRLYLYLLKSSPVRAVCFHVTPTWTWKHVGSVSVHSALPKFTISLPIHQITTAGTIHPARPITHR